MTALNKQALREAAQEEIMIRSVSDTSDSWQDEASQEAVLALLDELEAAEKRIAELEARTPYGYLRQCDGQIQISIGREQPHNRSGGYATPWFAIYTAAGIGVKGE
ncbi:ead/Ea22-like family protein [Citrobacter braakii]|uniref:ead/Ea22-like family protein n=1 Tax=Citrobacter braakii TaxID=57706 RepID=UPI001C7DA1B4|nr:ead/Ea22-like family protein [Citrobacter braakii]